MPPATSINITADQHSTLVEEDSIMYRKIIIVTHHGGGRGDADGPARDTKHGEPPACKDNTGGFSSALSETS